MHSTVREKCSVFLVTATLVAVLCASVDCDMHVEGVYRYFFGLATVVHASYFVCAFEQHQCLAHLSVAAAYYIAAGLVNVRFCSQKTSWDDIYRLYGSLGALPSRKRPRGGLKYGREGGPYVC